MTQKIKRNIERWVPHIITVAVLAGGGLFSYGRLSGKMEAMEENTRGIRAELYYLRERIDLSELRANNRTVSTSTANNQP